MKKNFVYAAYLCTIFFIGCNPSNAKKDKDGKLSSTTSSVEGANKIIEYTNDLMDVMKKYNEAANQALTYYEGVENKMSGKSSYAGSNTGMNFLWTEKKKAANAFGKAPGALAGDAAFFNDSAAVYNKLFKQFKDQDSTLALYLKGEDFKDDKFEKGKTIINSQFELFPQLVRLRNVINDKIETVADAAEAVSLKDSPIKEAFAAAKGDLAKVKKFCNVVTSKENFTDARITEMNTSYDELSASIEKNKNLDKTNLDKESKTASYNTFYKEITESVIEMKPVLRAIRDTKKLSEDDYNKINRIYESIIRDYNSWVN
jgi:hypothetical protein